MKSLAVRVLGDFGVDGVDPQALGSRKARLALHLLALAEGQAVPSDVLIDALWGDSPPARPEDQLASVARLLRHRAHRALGVPGSRCRCRRPGSARRVGGHRGVAVDRGCCR